MCIKALAFTRYPVNIVNIYFDGATYAVCITPNGSFETYLLDDLKIIDDAYLPNHGRDFDYETLD